MARSDLTAAIDIGSNTVRLLIASVGQGTIEPVCYFRKITRLAGGFAEDTGLAPAAMARTLTALLEIRAILLRYRIENPRAVGTEALRKACNGRDFVQEVSRTAGFHLEIIDGSTEARLSCLGVLSAIHPLPDKCLIFDIGGGSTEFILWQNGKIKFQASYPLGVVRLSESGQDPEKQDDILTRILATVEQDLQDGGFFAEILEPEVLLVGTAGTVTTLAAIDLELRQYDREKVNNHILSYDKLEQMLQVLAKLQLAEREKIPGMEEGRGDLIVPGLRVVLSLMPLFQKNSLVVSDAGLLEGIILDLNDRCMV